MSNLIRISGLGHSVGGRMLFDDLHVALNSGDRVGLVGHNGCGKSSLLSLIAGRSEPDKGEVQYQRGLRTMEVEQFLPAGLAELSLVDAVNAEPWRAEALLLELGFDSSDFALPVGSLSGGQQNRLMFARAVIDEPDVLLLDEPTNHLDLHTMVTFEQYLATNRSAFIVVSHDRRFLDTSTTRTWVLRDRRIYHYDMAYSRAREALQHHDETAAHALEQEEKKIDALRASAKRLNMWGKVYDNEKLARRGRAIDRRADKLEADKTFTTNGSPLSLSLQLGATRAREIVRVEDFTARVADRSLFHIDEFLIRPGERVALLGHNGVGKSTFIRSLVGATAAGIHLRPQTELGYYDQELDEIRGPATVQTFVRERVKGNDDEVRRALIHAGFAYDQHDKRVGDLSGGERARVLFVVLSLRAPNFLVLDEPTNHIDLEGKEQLERQLCQGNAAVLITSHDRLFIENVAQRFVWVREGRLVEIGDPEEFFNSAPTAAETAAAHTGALSTTSAGDPDSISLDANLQRLVELEDKLAADLARKPKFQKPALQTAWRAEIDALYRSLEQP